MGLSHTNRKESEFKLSSLLKGLKLVHENHFHKHYNDKTGECSEDWELYYRGVWDEVFRAIKDMQDGYISGTVTTFKALELIEWLSCSNVEQFKLASLLLSKPIHEDFFRGDGLRDVFEHFMLVRYGIAADMGMKTEWRGNMTRIAVRMPGLWYRIVTHYPSPRKIIQDWEKLTSWILSLDFRVDLKGSNLFVSVAVPPEPITDDMDPDFMATANYLVNIVRAGL
jgi:hypothetical protein